MLAYRRTERTIRIAHCSRIRLSCTGTASNTADTINGLYLYSRHHRADVLEGVTYAQIVVVIVDVAGSGKSATEEFVVGQGLNQVCDGVYE